MLPLNTHNQLPENLKWYALAKFTIPIFILSLFALANGNWVSTFLMLFFILTLPIWSLVTLSIMYVSFIVTESTITINSGIFFKKSITIPFNQVQNCDSSRGPLSSSFGLSRLRIWTASASQIQINRGKSDNKPDGELWLQTSQAQALKEFIASKRQGL